MIFCGRPPYIRPDRFLWQRQARYRPTALHLARQLLLVELDSQRVVLRCRISARWVRLAHGCPSATAGLLVMNTVLATGDVPLSAGFLAWREMCAKNPEFDVARLFARGNPQPNAVYMAPFPTSGHRAALRASAPVPDLMQIRISSRRARHFWQNSSGKVATLMASIGVNLKKFGPIARSAADDWRYAASGQHQWSLNCGHSRRSIGLPIVRWR